MRKLLGALVTCVLVLSSCAGGHEAPAQIEDLTGDFIRFYDDTAALPEAERIAAFKATVAARFPSFYGIERFEGRVTQDAQDRKIARALERFPSIRTDYTAKAQAFRASMADNMTRFKAAFPDFALERPVYLIHTLGEMDGGTRNLDGARRLIFGADGMAMYHQGWRTESAFFLHELFHIHQQPYFGECEQVWCMLWVEGVASYVAASLVPDANEAELLLDFPAGTVGKVRAVLPAALTQAKSVLDNGDNKTLAAMFSSGNDETGLPPRRGYLIGFLIAQEIARGRSLKDLPHLPRDEVRKLVEQAIERLMR